jgi:hypothetical protein
MPPVICKLLGHRRSRRDARRIENRWVSYCRWCGAMMVREAPSLWSAVNFSDGVATDPARETDRG